MKKIVVIFFVLSILSCSSENKSKIPIFNEIAFLLNEEESIGTIDDEIKKQYAELFNTSSIQIPLFKYIKHDNYRLFIGLPYNTSIEKMTLDQLGNPDSLATDLRFETDSISFFKAYNKDNYHLTEYAVRQKGNSLIFISTLSDSAVFSSASDFSNRITVQH